MTLRDSGEKYRIMTSFCPPLDICRQRLWCGKDNGKDVLTKKLQNTII